MNQLQEEALRKGFDFIPDLGLVVKSHENGKLLLDGDVKRDGKC